jgi:hypothetical protein
VTKASIYESLSPKPTLFCQSYQHLQAPLPRSFWHFGPQPPSAPSAPPGEPEPVVTAKGYQLADPAHGKHKHHAEHATYVRTLDEAASLVSRGFSLRMGAKGKSPSLIAPKSLRIVRDSDVSFA